MEAKETYTDVMIDFETLDTTPSAAVTQLGWCFFNRDALKGNKRFTASIENSIRYTANLIHIQPDTAKRSVSFSTFQWWLQQSEEARKPFVEVKERADLYNALYDFNASVFENRDNRSIRVWSMGADFDIPILLNCLGQTGLESPFKYNAHRCLRTLYDTYDIPRSNRTRSRVAHNAMEDAIAQAVDVVRIHGQFVK